MGHSTIGVPEVQSLVEQAGRKTEIGDTVISRPNERMSPIEKVLLGAVVAVGVAAVIGVAACFYLRENLVGTVGKTAQDMTATTNIIAGGDPPGYTPLVEVVYTATDKNQPNSD